MIEWTQEMIDDLGLLNDRQVAEKYDISIGSAYQKRKYLRIPPSNRRKRSNKVTTEEVVSLLRQGITQTDVAKHLGTTRQTVVQHMWKSGLEKSKPKMVSRVAEDNRIIENNKAAMLRLVGQIASEEQIRGFLKTLL